MNFTICIADRHILIHSLDANIGLMCMPYWTEEVAAPDIEIRSNEGLINAEYERCKPSLGENFDSFVVERIAVHRLLSEKLLSFDTFLMHGAVVAVDDSAYMFTAQNGIGKTTHIRSWLENAPGAYVVNGDKPFIIVREAGEYPLACGSPWAGKENLQTNAMVPLKAIVLMERAEENSMERVSLAQAFPFLLQQVFHPDDGEKMRKTLRLIQRLSPAVSFWRFRCNNFKDDCFAVDYGALTGKQA